MNAKSRSGELDAAIREMSDLVRGVLKERGLTEDQIAARLERPPKPKPRPKRPDAVSPLTERLLVGIFAAA